MYEAHFGLNRRPFVETADPAVSVGLPSREAVSRRVRYGLEHGQGAALIFGPHGSGKTQLARVLAQEIRAPSAHLTFPAMPAPELLGYLADELDADPEPGAKADPATPTASALRRLRRRLSSGALRGERPLLVVDEAHLIDDPASFEALRALLNFATLGPPDLMLLLVGGPELLLRLPPGLADRLTARCLLGPLTESESASYIHGRLAFAGASEPLFSSEAVATLHHAAGGLPRRLNRLADLALLIAYAEDLSRPDLRSARTAVREADPDGLAA